MTPGYEAAMRRIIGRDVTARVHARGVIITLPCSGGHAVEHQMEKMLPPDALKRQLANRGWITGRRITCPEHQKKDRTPMPSAIQPPSSARVAEPPTLEQTAAAKKVHRAVMEALMIAYDDDGKRYTSGYTDAKVATETGAACEYVRKVREDYFGPLAVPGELTGIRQEMDALVGSIALARRDMAQVRANADSRFDELDKLAKTISDKLDRIAKQNGWA